jgi:SNF2 family DNA or RNA helicase
MELGEYGGNHCLKRLERLLEKVKKTVQSKSDLQFLHKYRCDFEIAQPNLLVGGQLKKYQLEALEWMINLAAQSSNGILADDMGLGKTIQAISYWAYLKEEHGILGKHIIICPKSVAGNWSREIKKWFPSANVVLMITTCKTRDKFISEIVRPKKFDILITHY